MLLLLNIDAMSLISNFLSWIAAALTCMFYFFILRLDIKINICENVHFNFVDLINRSIYLIHDTNANVSI